MPTAETLVKIAETEHNVDVESHRDAGRELAIVLNCKPPKVPGFKTAQAIYYTGNAKMSKCIKSYCMSQTEDARLKLVPIDEKTKVIQVEEVRLHGGPIFKTVQEMFEYMVEKRGYRWVKQ